ncbi:MAG TPA: SprT family zinc-dependent metalloprotease [Nitrososphaerales archaeon]|nr:SprT family zinc-dependent metalloprotease [Nitrososphaerales archaeon]
MPFVDIGPHRIEYVVVKGESGRYTYFRFNREGILEIVVPRGRRVDLAAAIRGRGSWILKHYLETSRSRRVLDKDSVMFDGIQLKIVFEESNEPEELLPEPSRGEVIVRAADPSRVRELVRRWFLRESSRYVVRRAAELSRELGLKYKVVDVREMRSWGYCTKSGRISFSWQLIALPQRLRDYVVIHELSHLVEFNHSAQFKRRVAAVCPDYRERESELRRIIEA